MGNNSTKTLRNIIYLFIIFFLNITILSTYGNSDLIVSEDIKQSYIKNIKAGKEKLKLLENINFKFTSISTFSGYKETIYFYSLDGIYFSYNEEFFRYKTKNFNYIINIIQGEMLKITDKLNDFNLVIGFNDKYGFINHYNYFNVTINSELEELSLEEVNSIKYTIYNDLLDYSKAKLQENYKQKKYISKIDNLVDRLSKNKINKLKSNLNKIDFENKKYKPFRDILNYLEAKVLTKSISK